METKPVTDWVTVDPSVSSVAGSNQLAAMMPTSRSRAQLPSYHYASRAAALLASVFQEELGRCADAGERPDDLRAIEDALRERRRRLRARRAIVIVAGTAIAVSAACLALS